MERYSERDKVTTPFAGRATRVVVDADRWTTGTRNILDPAGLHHLAVRRVHRARSLLCHHVPPLRCPRCLAQPPGVTCPRPIFQQVAGHRLGRGEVAERDADYIRDTRRLGLDCSAGVDCLAIV